MPGTTGRAIKEARARLVGMLADLIDYFDTPGPLGAPYLQ